MYTYTYVYIYIYIYVYVYVSYALAKSAQPGSQSQIPTGRGLRLCHPLHCVHLLHELGQRAGLGTRGENDEKGRGAIL